MGDLHLSHLVFEALQSFRMNSIPEATETKRGVHNFAIDVTGNRTDSAQYSPASLRHFNNENAVPGCDVMFAVEGRDICGLVAHAPH